MRSAQNSINSTVVIGDQIFKNRVVVPPMASGTATSEGHVSPNTMEHYQKLSESCASLVIVEYTYVHPSGRSEENQLGADSDDKIDGLRALAKAIQLSGAQAGLQLTHAGGKSQTQLTGGPLLGPSPVVVPAKDQQLETPVEATQAKVDELKTWFVNAARRAALAGFDLIELHAAHGYGLNQWLSQITNHRTDRYGGSVANRSRLLFELVQLIRREIPQILISVRMPGQDFIEEGISISDSTWIAQELESLGVHFIHVSSGIGGWRRPALRTGEGYLVDEAIQIQFQIRIPVIGVGGIQTRTYIDELIQRKKVSFAAVGRAILKNPKEWGKENLCKTK